MTIQALNIALSGLDASQRTLDVISQNITNAGVEGYTRKILPQTTATGPDGTAFGVAVGNITRQIDTSLQSTLFGQISQVSSLSVQERYLNNIQLFHGSSSSGISLPATLDSLEQSFIELSSSPNDVILQQNVVNAATSVATRFNEFSELLSDTRNQVQDEIGTNVASINQLLTTIADLNGSISFASASNESTAQLEDSRDQAVAELSQFIEISTFRNNDAVLTVQTQGGTILAGETAQQLFFNPVPVTSTTVPQSVFVNDTTGLDLSTIEVGGSLGALLELRDTTVPGYQAQLDELSHKLALRFDAQGLRLFTDESGGIPGTTIGDYTDFASQIQVNSAILVDNGLVQDGTEPSILVGEASNDIISKILNFTFGNNEGVRVTGTANLLAAPTVQDALSLPTIATISGTQSLSAFTDITNSPDINAGDTFTIQIGTTGTQTISIAAGNDLNDLLTSLNFALGANGTASAGSNGQILIQANDSIQISAGTISAAGLTALGLPAGVTPPEDASFTIELSTSGPQTINISDTDTAADLLADLNAIPGLNASLGPSNELILEPEFGGDIILSDGFNNPIAALGLTFTNIAHVSTNSSGLGINGDIETRINETGSITDYSRSLINVQSNDFNNATFSLELEQDYQTTLQETISNQFGVDIDQEIALLIQVQANYSASARIVTASQELFDELLAAFS